jgi:hypothetical protein
MPKPIRSVMAAPSVRAALLSFALAGCGVAASDSLPREGISGEVTLDGQPLDQGAIQFIPASRKEGVAGGAVIQGGKYSIERGKGLVPGEYRVLISSSQGTPPAADSSDGGAPGPVKKGDAPKDLVPPQYNAKSTLTAEVKAGSPNALDFALKSK